MIRYPPLFADSLIRLYYKIINLTEFVTFVSYNLVHNFDLINNMRILKIIKVVYRFIRIRLKYLKKV